MLDVGPFLSGRERPAWKLKTGTLTSRLAFPRLREALASDLTTASPPAPFMHWTEPATADDSHAALEKKLWDAANMLWTGAET